MDSSSWIAKLLDLIQKHWHEPLGLVAGTLTSFLLVNVLLEGVPQHVGYGVGAALVWAFWHFSRRLPRGTKGKISFVVCISCERVEEARQLRADFTETLHSLVEGGEAGRQLELVVVPNHIAQRVRDLDDALRIRKRSRAGFMLYGRARRREVGEKDLWLLDLNGIVAHAQIPEATGKKFAQEFRELLPTQMKIEGQADVLAFEFASQLVHVVARYVMAIAAGISGSLDYAECLLREVESRLPNDPVLPMHVKIKKRLPRHFAAIEIARAAVSHVQWLKTHEDSDIARMCESLSQVPQAERSSAGFVLSQAICLFVRHRDATGALAVLRGNPHGEIPAWHFSVAFLCAYTGQLRRAIRHYRSLKLDDIDPATMEQVEEFFYWLEEEEPDNCYVNYCLGYVNWWIRNDLLSAREEFEKFLVKLPEDDHKRERVRVERLLRTALRV